MSGDAVAPASAAQRLVPILENEPIALDTYRLRLGDPVLARVIRPGQFVMIRPGQENADDPLLGRPFALYDVVVDAAGIPVAIDVVYVVVGRGTAALAQRRSGERLSIWGPLGNGFGSPPAGPVFFVAGGIGQTPFLALGRWWLGKMTYGREPSRTGTLLLRLGEGILQLGDAALRRPLRPRFLPALTISAGWESRSRSQPMMALPAITDS